MSDLALKSISTIDTHMAQLMENTMSTETPAKIEYSVNDDGVTHINVYTRGATVLGRQLSNLSECNIEHPYFGHFRTLEGLWYYMKTNFLDDEFRILKGMKAREKGKVMPSKHYPLFNKMFKLGMLEKLDRNPTLQEQLKSNDLPLAHYYVYGDRIHTLNHHQWQLDYWQLLRTALVNVGTLTTIRKELNDEIEFHLNNPEGMMARQANDAE